MQISCGNGKLILFGEHFVVHGTKALVAGFPKGVCVDTVVIEDNDRPKLQANVKGWGLTESSEGKSDVSKALALIADMFAINHPTTINMRANIPAGAGLGSSAAFAVAIIKALAKFSNTKLDDNQTMMRANRVEKLFHKNPSGVDAAAATYGGTLLFDKNKGIERINLPKIEFVIANSNQSKPTKTMVEIVAEFKRQNPVGFDRLRAKINPLIQQAIKAIKLNDLQKLGEAMNSNMKMLREIGVSTPKIDEMIHDALSAGALGAKITGAGGGGCIIAVATDEKISLVEQALLQHSPNVWRISI